MNHCSSLTSIKPLSSLSLHTLLLWNCVNVRDLKLIFSSTTLDLSLCRLNVKGCQY
jgi:hypothetical protein